MQLNEYIHVQIVVSVSCAQPVETCASGLVQVYTRAAPKSVSLGRSSIVVLVIVLALVPSAERYSVIAELGCTAAPQCEKTKVES